MLPEPNRKIRVWVQDGAEDQENDRYGSWPLANIRLANALKLKNYDFHFSFGKGTHNNGQGAAEFPAEMMWLWRGYQSPPKEDTLKKWQTGKNKNQFSLCTVKSYPPYTK